MKNQIIKDAFRQILGRAASALGGFVTIKLMTPFLGPLRYGDYNTILKYFAIRSALADLGLYTIALRELGKMKARLLGEKEEDNLNYNEEEQTVENINADVAEVSLGNESDSKKVLSPGAKKKLSAYYSKFMGSRILNMAVIYGIALVVAYLIPSYNTNPFIVWGLPLGMIFSATFVLGYFFQLPHQLFRSMHHTSISLVIARVGQIALLLVILYAFPHTELHSSNPQSIFIFLAILGTVVASGIFQIAWQWWTGRKYLTLTLDLDRSFLRKHIQENRKYGVGYFMSSFHTLAIGILLGWFYPTTEGFYYVGVRGLAMTLVEILLIVPASLGNSALHKIADKTFVEKRTSIGNLLTMIWILGAIVALNFYRFSDVIIEFVSGAKYLSSTLGGIGSDTILGFLGIVLLLTFTKQVFNYMFIATDKQNRLFDVNTRGVVIGIGSAAIRVYYYGIIGGIAGQLFVEMLYVIGALWIAYSDKLMPILDRNIIGKMIAWIIFACVLAYGMHYYYLFNGGQILDLIMIGLYNCIVFGLIYKTAKGVMRGV